MKFSPFIILTFFLFSCGGGEQNTEEETTDTSQVEASDTEDIEEVLEEEEEEEVVNPYLVKPGSFYGININDNIKTIMSEKPDLLKKGLVQNGEGDFEVYDILDEDGEVLAHIYPGEKDEVLGMEIISEKASTPEGLKIGDTFTDVLKIDPSAKAHGSEIEGWVYVEVNEIAYKLDMNVYTYDIPEAEMNNEAKILLISI